MQSTGKTGTSAAAASTARRSNVAKLRTVYRSVEATPQKPAASLATRSAGVLMHLTSLPGPYGSGDLGPASRTFVDFLSNAGQCWWQMLPVTPPGVGPGYSPYSSDSAFAGSPWLISLEALADEGLLTRDELSPPRTLARARKSLFTPSIAFREDRLRRAFARFEKLNGQVQAGFDEFRHEHRAWLDDYALYRALKALHGGAGWTEWDPALRQRAPAALADARRRLSSEIAFHQFVQYQFDRQWRAFKAYCAGKKIGLVGDIPIFVAHDSADVWAHPELFTLDRSGRPTTVSGVPPDLFSKDGQRWGHPHFRWDVHKSTGYEWWLARLASMFDHFDAVRIDHFIGFHRYWSIPARAATAKAGRWMPGGGEDFFHAVRTRFGDDAQIIAEDLGSLTEGAIQLRDRFGLPGMRVIQFAFGDDPESTATHAPHAYPKRTVAYTGTHDNDTLIGWLADLRKRARNDAAAKEELSRALDYAGASARDRQIQWAFIRAVYSSQANTAIVPMQDLLGLGSKDRMNTPGTCDGNWTWRMPESTLTPALAQQLRRLTQLFGRA